MLAVCLFSNKSQVSLPGGSQIFHFFHETSLNSSRRASLEVYNQQKRKSSVVASNL